MKALEGVWCFVLLQFSLFRIKNWIDYSLGRALMLPAAISSTAFGDNQFFPRPTATFEGAGKNITSFSAS